MTKRKIDLPKFGRRDDSHQRALARLDAVLDQARFLVESEQAEAALRLLEQNLARYAQFAGMRAALASVYGELGRYMESAENARMAVDLAPGRADYRLLAAVAYFSAGYFSFAARERRAWLRSAPGGPLLGEMQALEQSYAANGEQMRAKYGVSSLATMEQAGLLLDEGRWALDHRWWAQALEHSQAAVKLAPGWPSPHNNVTVTLVYLQRYREAREEARAVLADLDAQNIHALANLIFLSVVLQEPDEANEAANRLAGLPPAANPAELDKQIQGLSWLDRDADIDRILKTAKRKRLLIGPDAHVHWGVAAANAGRRREARDHLRLAQQSGVGTALLLTTLRGLEERRVAPGISARYPQTHYADLVPQEALTRLLELLQKEEKTGLIDQTARDALLARYPQLPAALGRIMYEEPGAVEQMAHVLVKLGGTQAKEILQRFVGGQLGDDEARMSVLHAMQEARMIPADEPVEMWLRGKQQPVLSRFYEIADEFGADYSEKAIDAYEQAAAAHAKKNVAEAIRLYRLALSIEPKLKEAYNNLAVLLDQQGDTAGSQECLEKALAIDPLYPFPLVAVALQALYRDGPGAAKEILKPLAMVERWRPLDMVVYQKGLAKIALAERDYDFARKAIEIAREIKADDPELKDLMLRLESLEVFDPTAGLFAQMDERNRERRRRKRLPPDPALADCLGIVSVGDMVGMAHTLGLWLPSPRLRNVVEAEMLAQLQDPEVVGAAVGELSEQERGALKAILDAGGVMAWAQFAEQFGDESADRPYLEYWAELMKSVPGRLRARGLIFYGTIEGQQVVVIPEEVRGLVAGAM